MADMYFLACSCALCTILKKEGRKVVESAIWKIVIMADMDFVACS